MSEVTTLPSAAAILAAPELATLAILDTVLAVSRTELCNQYPGYPDLGEADDLFYIGRAPSDSMVRASLIVHRIDDLRSLIEAYRACLREGIARMQAGGLPF
jgi:hypothetical protein